MGWSSSQDDDGLESANPFDDASLVGQGSGFPASTAKPSPSQTPVSTQRPTPSSSAPRSSPSGSPSRLRSAEPTLVLAQRQLDILRAEVKKRRRLFLLQQQGSFLAWALAGGLAVAGGAYLARSWTEDESEPAASTTDARARVDAPSVADAPVVAAASLSVPPAEAPVEAPVVAAPAPVVAAPVPVVAAPVPTGPGAKAAPVAVPGKTKGKAPRPRPDEVISLEDIPAR